jgi:Domain of unknown function (DUF927)
MFAYCGSQRNRGCALPAKQIGITMSSHQNGKSCRKLRDRKKADKRRRDRRQDKWRVRRYRMGTLTGPAYVEFKFPTEGGGMSRLCIPNSDLRHSNALLDQFANLLPIFPKGVPAADEAHKQFIQGLVASANASLELVPTSTGFIDQNTFVTHGEIIRADGTRVVRPRLDGSDVPAADVAGTAEGARANVLKLARYSTYLAFAIGVELAACLPSYLKFRPARNGENYAPISETAAFNFSGKSSSGKSSTCLAAISLAGSPTRAGSLDLSRRGLAEIASDSNDLAFVLDDTEKGEEGPGAFVRTVKAVVHMVPGGRSKIISRGVDQTRFPQLRWTAFALTSSPRAIPELAAKHRWQMSPGDKVRLFDISVPSPKRGGIFDRIKGGAAKRAKRGIKLIAKLQRGYTSHHGHTLPEWAIYLMAEDRSEQIIKSVNAFIDHVEARGNGWEVRFATKFGLVYAAMKAGTDAGLLPWRSSLPLSVASKCYRKARAAARRPKERVRDAVMQLHRFLKDDTRVVDPRTDGKPVKITNRTVAIRYRKDGRLKFGVLDRALLKIAGARKTKESFAKMLVEARLVTGGHGHARTHQERISTIRNGNISKRTRFWIVDARRFERFVTRGT